MSAEVEIAAGRREDDGPALGPTSDACWLAAARRFEDSNRKHISVS